MTDKSSTPRTDEAIVSAEYIRREMDYYTYKFVLADVARQLERELTAARAEAEALRKDAERYRRIRENWIDCDELELHGRISVIDAAIDAARSTEGK